MKKFFIVLPEIFSKTQQCSWIFRRTRFFPDNPALSVSAHYCPETSCQVSERSIEKLTDKQMNERMNKGQSIGPTSYVGGFKTKEKLAGF